jgi:hypothetical protein
MRKIFLETLRFTILMSLIVIIISCEDYKEPEYIVTFNANGASGSPPSPMKAFNAYGASEHLHYYTVNLPDQGNLIYKDKIFYGWNTKADGTGRLYFPYISEYSLTPQITKNTTMYAQWENTLFPPVQNLKLTLGNGFELSWDPVPRYQNLEDPFDIYKYDGRKFITYVILRRATNAGSWTTNNFVPFGFSSEPNYRDTRYDISAGGTFEYIVALGIVTAIKNLGSDYDVFLGSHSNISNGNMVGAGFVGAGNFMPAPTMFDVVVNSATSVTLSWRRAVNLNSHPCLGFYVFYNVVPSGSTIDGRNWVQENVFIPYNDDADFYTSFRHTYTKTTSPSTTYYFSVAAVYSDGRGELATPIQVTTPEPPIRVTGLTATAYLSTCINLSWNDNDQASAYKIYYEKGTSTEKFVADSIVGTTFSHTGLEPDTVYRYSIRAISIDKESYQYSNTVECRTLVSSVLPEPVFLIITNNSYVPLRTIKINNGENRLTSDLYKCTSYKTPLSQGTYAVTVYDTENRQNNFDIEINDNDVRYIITDSSWPPAGLTVRNNHGLAISSAYLRILNTGEWGNNRLNGSLVTNSSQFLGNFSQGLYEAYAASTQYYRVTSGTAVNGITVTGGVIDGYRDIWYYMPSFILAVDTNLTFPANGWSLNKPD